MKKLSINEVKRKVIQEGQRYSVILVDTQINILHVSVNS